MTGYEFSLNGQSFSVRRARHTLTKRIGRERERLDCRVASHPDERRFTIIVGQDVPDARRDQVVVKAICSVFRSASGRQIPVIGSTENHDAR